MSNSTSLKSIAFELGISINTVSRALRDCDDISDATKEKVRQKAVEMGYVPNSVSQFIKRNGRKLVGVILNNFENPYFQIVSDKLVTVLTDEECDFTTIYSSSGKFSLSLLKQCISERVDAIITLLEPDDDVIACAKLNHMPIVMLGRHLNNDYCDEVYTDDDLGGKLVANYLTNFHAIDKFIYVRMPNVECSKRRQEAFTKTVHNLNPDAEIKIVDFEAVNESFITLVENGYRGVFCFSDEVAYELLFRMNKALPNFRKVYPHFHIVGFDCVSTRIHGYIDITSIDSDYDAICEAAVNMMMKRFDNPNLPKDSKMFPVMLHQRQIL